MFEKNAPLHPIIELVTKDRDLQLEIRLNEVHIYYIGGKCMHITLDSNNRFCISNIKSFGWFKGKDDNAKKNNPLLLYLNSHPQNPSLWVDNIDKIKAEMKGRLDLSKTSEYGRTVSSKYLERNFQQEIEKNNQDFNKDFIIVDIEYQTSNSVTEEELLTNSSGYKTSKIDMIAIRKNSDEYDIELIELKQGDGSIGSDAGLKKHYEDFKVLIDRRREDIKKTVENNINFKIKHNIFKNALGDIKLSGKISASFLLYNLDENNPKYLAEVHSIKNQERDFELFEMFLNRGNYDISSAKRKKI